MSEITKPLLGRKGRGEKMKKRMVHPTTAPDPRQDHTRYIVQDCDADPAKSFMLFADSWGVCYLAPCQEVRA